MDPVDPQLLTALSNRFPGALEGFGDDPAGPLVPVGIHLALAHFLREWGGFSLYVTVVATHWPATGGDPEHFEVATILRRPRPPATTFRWRVRLAPDEPIPSLVPVFAGADWQEREQFDLVGVRFADHPDLRRLMMPEDYRHHPLRKDFRIDARFAPWR